MGNPPTGARSPRVETPFAKGSCMTMKLPKLIVFDMDGVLIDVSGSYRETARKTARLFFTGAKGFESIARSALPADRPGGTQADRRPEQRLGPDRPDPPSPVCEGQNPPGSHLRMVSPDGKRRSGIATCRNWPTFLKTTSRPLMDLLIATAGETTPLWRPAFRATCSPAT